MFTDHFFPFSLMSEIYGDLEEFRNEAMVTMKNAIIVNYLKNIPDPISPYGAKISGKGADTGSSGQG